MAAVPVSPNRLGLENSQQRLGGALLLVGTSVGLLVLLRYSALAESPLLAWDAATLAGLTLFAIRRCYVGLRLLFARIVDTQGPAPLDHLLVKDLLRKHTLLLTHLPGGLGGDMLHRLAPRVYFLSPDCQGLGRGILLHLLFGLAVGVGLFYAGPLVLPLACVVGAALIGRVLALRAAVAASSQLPQPLTGASPAGQPPGVEIMERREHLTNAGNPVDLYFRLRNSFEELREQMFPNTFLCNRDPVVGVNAPSNKVIADLLVETQPMAVARGGHSAATPLILESFGALLEVTAGGLLLWAESASGGWNGQMAWRLAGLLALWYGSAFLLMAHRMLCSFRFRSDVIWLQFEGTYQWQRLAVGGGLAGLPSSEAQSVKSDMYLYVWATRLISECIPQANSVVGQLLGAANLATKTVQTAPRYVVRAQKDAAFKERLDRILKAAIGFEDDSTRLRTPDLQASDVQHMVLTGLNILSAQQAASSQRPPQSLAGQPRTVSSAQPSLPSPSPQAPPTARPKVQPPAGPPPGPVATPQTPQRGTLPPPPPPPRKKP